MNILFFTEISPFPINGGASIRSYGLLKAFSELGYKVDAIIGNVDEIDLNNYCIRNVKFIDYRPLTISIFEKITGLHYFKKKKEIIQLFDEQLKNNKPDLVFIDYGFLGQYISYFKKQDIPIIYGTHNSQSDLTKQQPANNFLRKIRIRQIVFIEKLHEHIFFFKANQLIVVCKEDKDFHSKFLAVDKIAIIPNFLDENRYNETFEKEDYFVMTANFGAYMNHEGLKWLVKNVWNHSLDEECHLILVGKNSNEALASIPESKKYRNIVSYGSVEDITPYIGKAKAVLIPLFHGSGSRLKCLEAMALKTLIISTSKGVEGIKSNDIFLADNPEEFRQLIIDFKYNSSLGEKLYEDFMKNYSLDHNKLQLDKIIKQVLI